jgi:hypothetical protein
VACQRCHTVVTMVAARKVRFYQKAPKECSACH